ncbi:MAG TPA: helix-turn-helix domain-containing protein [Candidatus Limnocylindrales bacterium]|nr:helix-turn-helix domain-containing protein [Candidatus Limnocylindrales bacterium]
MPADTDDELITIGRFARLSGLSIGALRHYDELDLLHPADVDRFTGYRRYRRAQLDTARVIARLRDLEVPIEDIRDVLASDDPAEQRRLIAEQRRRAQARADQLHYRMHVLTQLSSGKEPLVATRTAIDPATDLDGATHRRLGRDLFNFTWTLIEKADRTPAEIDEMIHAAHASTYHWSKAEGATIANLARGEWQCSRVYSVLGRGEPAVWHAKRCLALVEAAEQAGEAEDWDRAGAYEALARSHAVAGDRAEAEAWRDRAKTAIAKVENELDRGHIEDDIATLPL